MLKLRLSLPQRPKDQRGLSTPVLKVLRRAARSDLESAYKELMVGIAAGRKAWVSGVDGYGRDHTSIGGYGEFTIGRI